MSRKNRKDIWMQSYDVPAMLLWMVLALRKEVQLVALQPGQRIRVPGTAVLYLQSLLGHHTQHWPPVFNASSAIFWPSNRANVVLL